VLEIRDVRVCFDGVPAVDGVSLDLPAGEVLAVLGASGSGKSTLLRAVAGLERLESGTVAYDGQDLAPVPTHRRGFALMFQDGQLFPQQSVAGNVGYPLRLRRTPRARVARRVEELAHPCGDPRRGRTTQPQRVGDVAGDGQVGEELPVLEHQREAALVGGRAGQVGAVPRDRPGRERLEARDGAQQGGLPAPRRAEHGEHLSRREVERHVVDGRGVAVAHGHVPECQHLRTLPHPARGAARRPGPPLR